MNKKKFLYIVTLLLLFFTLLSCFGEEEYVPNFKIKKYSYPSYLDTSSNVTLQYDCNKCSDQELEKIMNGIDTLLLEVEKKFSPEMTIWMRMNTTGPSELMNINSSKKLDDQSNPIYYSVSSEFINLLEKSNDVSILLNGNFDVTIGPLTSLWNISNQVDYLEENIVIPTNEQILESLSLINYEDILIDKENSKIAFKKENMKLDFGAIAKGYACDKVYEYLKAYDFIKLCMIDLGGNIYTYGEAEGITTSMAIRNPFSTGTEDYTILDSSINNVSMVTSGIYERYIVKDGVTYHHLLNPITGYPFDNNIESVTIIGTSSMTCDALATGIYGLGLEQGIEAIKKLPDYNAVFITKDKKVYVVGDLPYTPTEGLVGFEFINIK